MSRFAASPALPWFVGAACLAVFFRHQLADGFTLLNGDRHDGLIALALLEHWWNVLRGDAAWNVTGYFHPVPGTLGYNDGYLLLGLLHAAARAAGADPLLAAELANVAARAIGFAATYALGRQLCGLDRTWSCLLAALFTLANGLFIRASHVQLFSISFVPVLALLAHGAVAALLGGRRGAFAACGAGFALWFAAMLLTGFYMAWYSALFGAALTLAWLAVAGATRRQILFAALRAQLLPLAALAALAVALNLPFLLLYLPKAAETGMWGWDAVSRHLVAPLDMIHVGEGNLIWGWLVTALNDAFRPGFPAWSERMTGLPPGLLLLFAVGTAAAWRRRAAEPWALAVALAALATWALTWRFGEFSAWRFVWAYVPGAGAARVVARYQLFLLLPIAVVAVTALARWAPRLPRVAVAGGVLLLLAEQTNRYAPLFLDRPLEAARLAALGSPPAACRAFIVTAARTESRFGEAVDDAYNHNTEAMSVAAVIGLPTLNGISTFNPPLWTDALPDQPSYRPALRRWAEAYGANAVCGLDLRRFAWEADPLGLDSRAAPAAPR